MSRFFSTKKNDASQQQEDSDKKNDVSREDSLNEPAQRRDPDKPVQFDDALMRIGLGRGQTWSMIVMCLLWIGEGMQMFICFYLPKAFYDEWQTPVDDLAWVDGAMFAGVMVGALVGGHCGDAYGRRPTLLLFTAVSVITGLICWITWSFVFLFSIRFLVGFGAGGFAPCALALSLEGCPSMYRGAIAIAVPGFSGAAGRLLTAIVAEALYDPDYNPNYSRMGWRGAMVLCCVPFLLALCLGFYTVSESARWLFCKGRQEEASDALANLALKNGTEHEFPRGTKLIPETDAEYEEASNPWVRIGREPLFSALVLCSVSHLCLSVAYFGMIFALPVYLESYGAENGWTEQQKDIVLVIVAASEIPAIFLALYTIEVSFIGRKYTVISCMVGCAMFSFTFNFHIFTELMHSSFAVIISTFLARGFAAAGLITGNLYMAEIFPTGTRAASSSVARASGQFGAVFAPIMVGILLVDWRQDDIGMWTKLHPLRVWVLFTIFSLVGAFLFYELGMETGGKHLPNTEEDTMDAQDLDAKFYNKLGDLGKAVAGDTTPLNASTDKASKRGVGEDNRFNYSQGPGAYATRLQGDGPPPQGARLDV